MATGGTVGRDEPTSLCIIQQLITRDVWAKTHLRVKDLEHLLHANGFSLVSGMSGQSCDNAA